jgi:predicted RNA-binding Zn-ribbon protein involved in translation (DUF1610 family)
MPIVGEKLTREEERKRLRTILRYHITPKKSRWGVLPSKEFLDATVEVEAARAEYGHALSNLHNIKRPETYPSEKQLLAEHKLRQKQWQVEKVKGLMVAKCSGTSRMKCPKCGCSRVKIWKTIVTLANRCGKRLLCPTCGWTNGRTDGNG